MEWICLLVTLLPALRKTAARSRGLKALRILWSTAVPKAAAAGISAADGSEGRELPMGAVRLEGSTGNTKRNDPGTVLRMEVSGCSVKA